MDISIFIKSYRKDFRFLKYALLSIKKNVTGYKKVVIILPEHDKIGFELPDNTEVINVKEHGNGYLFQQVCKMNAHKYCNSKYIMFSDSDVIFDHKINLQELVIDDKPEILFTDYTKVGDAICWKSPTEYMLNRTVDFEFMRRNTLIYHASTLEKIEKNYPNLTNTILKSTHFSEFNFIGAWAYYHDKENYNFVNTDRWNYVPPHGTQLWSWADKNGDVLNREEYQRSLETINNALELNITEL